MPEETRRTTHVFGLGTIRTRLLIVSVATILLTAIAISAASAAISLRNGRREAIDRLELVASLRGIEIDEWVKDVNSTLAGSMQQAPEHRFVEPEVANVVAALVDNPAGSEEHGQAYGFLAYNFDLWLRQAQQFEVVFFMDRDGKVLVSTDPSMEGQILADETYFQLGTTGSYLAPVSYSHSRGRPTTFASRPILGEYGRLLGVLAGSVDASTLGRLMRLKERASLGDTGESYLVSRDRTLLTNSRFAEAGSEVNTDGVAAAIEEREREEEAGAYVVSPAATGGSGTYDNYASTPVIGVYHWLPDLQAALMVEQSRAEVFSPVYRSMLLNGVVALVSALVAGVISLSIAQGIGNRLGALAETASQIALGDLERRARVGRGDEIGALADAFNTMTARLRGLIGSLEQRVAERTSDLEERSAYLEASAQVARAASSILDANELIQEVVNLVRDRFGLYYVGLFLIDEMGEWAELRAGTGEAGQQMLAQGHKLRVAGESMIGQCVARAEARIALDVGKEAVRFDNPLLPKTRSEAALPLQSRGRVFGAMTVQSSQPAAFDEDAITVWQTMAEQVAVALDNAYLFAETQSAVEAARRASAEASRQAWAELLRTQPVAGYHCDDRGVVTAENIWRPEMEQAVREGRVVHARLEDPSSGDGARQPVAVPITVAGEVIGVLDTYKPGDAAPWTDEEIGTLESLAEQLGVSLESARLYRETQRRAAREQLVGQIARRLRATMDPDVILKTTVQELGQALGAELTSVQMGVWSDSDRSATLPSTKPKESWAPDGDGLLTAGTTGNGGDGAQSAGEEG
ncbi:MAG: GAF domain-containing protein [Anaerolineae bacterium]|jgi:GAF domain-containing protein/HAMP domain-containing protein